MGEVTLHTPVGQILANKRRVGALKSLGIVTVADALAYYPFRVTDPVPVRTLNEARLGAKMACAVHVRACRATPMAARRGYRLEVAIDDGEFAASREQPGSVASLVFFSHRKSYVDWMASRCAVGANLVIAGEPSVFNDRLQFTHPEVLTVGGEGSDAASALQGLQRACRPRPVYHASSRISSDHIHDAIMTFMRLLAGLQPQPDEGDVPAETMRTTLYGSSPQVGARLDKAIPSILPEEVRRSAHLLGRAEAFSEIHDPDSVDRFRDALETLRYEEAFVCQTALLMARDQAAAGAAWPCEELAQRDAFIDALPFELTAGQRDVIDDIAHDMERDHPMQRLLQGEVGSGKTVVAIAAMLQATGSGHQAVLVAPTQVLAEQHYESISKQVSDVPVLLLTGGMKLAARRKVLGVAASGEPCIIIATHAAFSKTFQAPNLALAVIDEQHRFGVEQRETLRGKGEREPHLLVMTATPIPRTAAMTWFGDLDISWLTELPGGRKPIRTFIVQEDDSRLMAEMFALVRQRIDAGERAYVICPRIDIDDDVSRQTGDGDDAGTDGAELLGPEALGEDAEGGDAPRRTLHSVEEMFSRLQNLPQFKGVAFAQLTGRDNDTTKKAVMDGFAGGATPVLVATTVVEVGVDVPQASCIVIFDADLYGLSQLHQLRGRVGRGGTNSWAFLISRSQPGTLADERLHAIEGSLDGAEIAQKDLLLRGAGDVLGDSQSGVHSSLKLLRVVKDASIIEEARAYAEALLDKDPELAGHVELAGAVLDFTRGNEAYLTSS